MRAWFHRCILLVSTLGLTLKADAQQWPRDRWGQTPNPEIADKVKRAVAINKEQFDAAEQLLREALTKDADFYGAQLNLGLLLLQKEERSKDALAELNKANQIAQQRQIDDPTIYAELGFAAYRADKEIEAKQAFQQGVEHLAQMKPSDQKKLLERGVAFFLDYQNPSGARQLIDQSTRYGADLNILKSTNVLLNKGIKQMTKHDVQDGWVRYAKQPIGAESNTVYTDELFKKIDGMPGPIKKGDIVTPSQDPVNIRADKLHPENTEATLATWIGIARIDEKFVVLEDPIPIPTPEAVALWMRIERVKE